jgi:hypothetical protein
MERGDPLPSFFALKAFLLISFLFFSFFLFPWLCFGESAEQQELNQQSAAIAQVQAEVNILFNRLLAELKKLEKTERADALSRSEQAFEDGKNAEAVRRAKVAGAVGGSALAEDCNAALLAMLREHQAELARQLRALNP